MNEDLRKFEVLREGTWTQVRLAEIRRGEQFKYVEGGIEHLHEAASDGWWCNMNNERTLQAAFDKTNAAIIIEGAK